jgi:ubiquinone/menaquinone biosynthesis C-methylase UbiE
MHIRHRNLPGAFQGRSSRVYDVVARRLLRGFYRSLADDIAESAPRDATVLDVGTGPGVLLVELARRRPDLHLVGVDLSSDMVEAANRNLASLGGRAEARVGDVTELPFPDRHFDLIVSSLSLHHWDRPDVAIAELGRVIRPGGRLCIYDFGFAPFDTLVTEARNRSLFTGAPPQRAPIRARILFFPRCHKHVMTAAAGPVPADR